MKIEFWLRIPGNHIHHSTVEWDAVPRQGESVEISKEDFRVVHEVTWYLPNVAGGHKDGSARVLLR